MEHTYMYVVMVLHTWVKTCDGFLHSDYANLMWLEILVCGNLMWLEILVCSLLSSSVKV